MRFYFAFRSPYAWIASRLLKELLSSEARAQLAYIPYWEPNDEFSESLAAHNQQVLYQPMSRSRHLYILQDIKRLSQYYGLNMKWPLDGKRPAWEIPHLAFIAARQLGPKYGETCFEAIYRARWERGEDICEVQTIKNIAAEIEVPADLLVNAVNDSGIREQALKNLQSSIDDAVFGIPFFVVGREHFWGVDRMRFALDAMAKKGLLGINQNDILQAGLPKAQSLSLGVPELHER